jgi:menaquinol-cytochrome c reductase iron-sulfur subunit
MLVPLTSGLVVFLSPLWRKTKSPQVRVALLSQVPEDGTPHFFPVSADRTDAWNRYPQQRIGGVYLLREKNQDQNKSGQKPIALTAKCPHAGCFIGYAPGADAFRCPCHTSTFHLDGARVHGDAEVSPRDMDRLPVELRPVGTELSRAVDSNEAIQVASTADLSNVRDAEIWVEYIEFQTGHKQQIRAV